MRSFVPCEACEQKPALNDSDGLCSTCKRQEHQSNRGGKNMKKFKHEYEG